LERERRRQVQQISFEYVEAYVAVYCESQLLAMFKINIRSMR